MKVKILMLCCLALMSLSACSHKVVFQGSVVVPAATGYTKLSHDDNDNNVLNVHVMNLALPAQLTPPKAMYVVWVDTKLNGVKNMGQLKVSDKLKGSLTTNTPFLPVRIFITAEHSSNLPAPTGTEVMSSANF